MKTIAITRLSAPDVNEMRDNGRRGDPRPGCDCVQCFGYCINDHDPDAAIRVRAVVDVVDADDVAIADAEDAA